MITAEFDQSAKLKIVVLAGGTSPERNVSLASGDAVGQALVNAGHEVVKVDPVFPNEILGGDVAFLVGEVGERPPEIHRPHLEPAQVHDLLSTLTSENPDVVFPILHGGWGENGELQALLQLNGFRYVGSEPRASAVAMHKPTSKRLFQWKGIPTTDWLDFLRNSSPSWEKACHMVQEQIGYPAVFKPANGGSTIGLTRVSDESGVKEALEAIFALEDDAMVEPWIEGRELTVSIVADEALPVIEIKPHEGYYDYLNKYTHGQTDYICPADLPHQTTAQLAQHAEDAFAIIGCRHFARVDFLATQSGEAYCLEVNTLPGMTSTSLVPKAAKAIGLSFPELADKLVRIALHD
jgi:D-alanine-D-alanine ligase